MKRIGHKCDGMREASSVSIYYEHGFGRGNYKQAGFWRMDVDYQYDIDGIHFCPFCGKKLIRPRGAK